MLDAASVPPFRPSDWKFRVVDGRYRVCHVLSRSANSAVLAVTDRSGRSLALKVSRRANDEDAFLRAVREFEVLRSIDHPAVVRCHRLVDVDEDHVGILMDCVPGRSVHDLVRNRTVLGTGRAVSLVRQVAEALAAVHDAGWLHRDVKPANIVVDIASPRPRATLVDFGVAGPLANFCPEWFSGTPTYASPEQIRREPLDERSDVYGLGATLYFMLTGRPPFLFDDLSDRFEDHRLLAAETLSEAMGIPFPSDLDRLVASMIALDRNHRPSSMAAVCDALDALRPATLRFSAGYAQAEPHDDPTVVAPLEDPTVHGVSLEGVLSSYVDAMLEDYAVSAVDEREEFPVWTRLRVHGVEAFTLDEEGVVYAAPPRSVVSTSRCGHPRDIRAAGSPGCEITALHAVGRRLWVGTDDGRLILHDGEDTVSESAAPDGQIVAALDVDPETGDALVLTNSGAAHLVRDHGRRWWTEVQSGATGVAIAPGGRTFAIAAGNKVVLGTLHENSWELGGTLDSKVAARSVRFVNRRTLAVVDETGTVWAWDIRCTSAPAAHLVQQLAGDVTLFNRGGLLAAQRDSSGVTVWDIDPAGTSGWIALM